MRYTPTTLEKKWQERWEKEDVYATPRNLEELKKKPKYYILDMFPYPSGSGLHVGHPLGYIATDILSRYKRMRGYHVLHPMGWDAFGLPAERAAMRENIHPAKITKNNIENFKKQIRSMGLGYDWKREISTTDPQYYKWTQWIFIQLHKKGLAYLEEVPVNWCEALGTVLANEEVKDGKYVETGDPIERRKMKQWMLKITAYAERLLEDLEELDWPESVKEMQRNWIGKSVGANVKFFLEGRKEYFEVFTTRPDTLFGATYCVLAPEHPLALSTLTKEAQARGEAYVKEALQKSDFSRSNTADNKTGVFTGSYAINPVNDKKIPIWVGDYVLGAYGSAAIMAVPAHDERDHAFAKQYDLDIVEVVQGGEKPIEEEAYCGEGILIHSSFLDGLSVEDAKEKIIAWLEEKKLGKKEVQYRLRDWLFSRQRYWGEPFPIVHLKDGSIQLVEEEELPVELPLIDQYKPTEDGKAPLNRASADWLNVKMPDGSMGKRETNTMPQWAGSCWYYLRYIDPSNLDKAWDRDLEKYWMPVDLYVGGIEHAVLHLLYARFWHKVLYDCGYVSTKEPFQKLFSQGMMLSPSYQNPSGKYFHPDMVRKEGKEFFAKETGEKLKTQIEKMSKSKLNVINPDDVIKKYGADTLRLYEMFMGPLEQSRAWHMDKVDGIYRFLSRVWRLVMDENTGKVSAALTDTSGDTEQELWKLLQQTIKKVEEDTENLHFNTAISQMMIFVNKATAKKTIPKPIMQDFLKLLSPYAPYIAQELWSLMKERDFVLSAKWPSYDPALCVEESITVVVLINGKKRAQMQTKRGVGKEKLEKEARSIQRISEILEKKQVKKVIVVPDKLVNFVG